MKNAGYTKQERSFIVLMRILAVMFLGTGMLFAASPDYLPNYVASIGTNLIGWNSQPLAFGTESYWIVMSITLFFSLSYICIIAQHNLVHNIGYARPVILAKLSASAGFAACFYLYEQNFVYLAAAVFEGLICLVVWRFYRKALSSRA